jgi:hypothetical protein
MQHRRHNYAAVRRILIRDKAGLLPWLRTLSAPFMAIHSPQIDAAPAPLQAP